MKRETSAGFKRAKAWVEVYYSLEHKYKTAIDDPNPIYYNIVTRVNYLTACLWYEHMSKRINNKMKGLTHFPTKVNWLIMNRAYRRKMERVAKILDYLTERKKRKKQE